MLKYIILLINSLSVLLFNIFFSDGITVTPKLPSTAAPGSEFMAEIVINKGGVGGFAKLQIDLPQGFTAKEVDSKGANFTYANGTAKYIWTALPSDPEFTVKFMIVADASCKGAKPVQGKFSYILNNAKQQNDFGPIEIVMEENGSTAVVTETNANPVVTETPTVATTPPSFVPPVDPNATVSAYRTITALNKKEYQVNVQIKKENIKGFAKYVDKIPAGFIASAVQTNGASFTFADQNAKFVWVSLPGQEEMSISYVVSMQSASPNPVISGEFSYLENDATQKIKTRDDIIPVVTDENITPVETNTVVETPVETNTVSPAETNTVTETPVETNTVVATTPTVAATPTVTEEPVVVSETPVKNVVTSDPAIVAPSDNAKSGAVNFNVQIGAYKNSMSADKLGSVYNINDEIRTVMHEGYTKFLIGNYNEYKQARDKRESVKNKGVSDAFVTAYNGGKRITVQEALMIANQKWLR